MIRAFPKIFALGTTYISKILHDEVEVTEKIDGSQFVFGKDKDGELWMRSKGKVMYRDAYDKMFDKAVEYVTSIEHLLFPNTAYYCEYLRQEKHNVLRYSRIPKNNLVLWGISNFMGDQFYSKHSAIVTAAERLGIEPVRLVHKGLIKNVEKVLDFIDTEESQLGGQMEGVVVKNYEQQFLLGGQPIPVMAGKYVSEKFKEVHRTSWSKEHTNGGKWQAFKLGYNTEARWHKAIQHLRDNGELEGQPRDIGKLVKAIQSDIVDEEQDNIKDFLWKHFGQEVLRTACQGFPEFYKRYLAEEGTDAAPDTP